MTDQQIAEKLIRWVVSIKYYSHDKGAARRLAIEDLAAIKNQYGWLPMKRSFREKGCTGIVAFKILCDQHKKLSEKAG